MSIIPEANFLQEYLPIAIFFSISIGLAVLVSILPWLFAKKVPNNDKIKSYECGFDPFDHSRSKFDIRFYLVAILFIIFDLEVTFLIPWAITLGTVGWIGFWSMMLFLAILTTGFIYEWKKGALNW